MKQDVYVVVHEQLEGEELLDYRLREMERAISNIKQLPVDLLSSVDEESYFTVSRSLSNIGSAVRKQRTYVS